MPQSWSAVEQSQQYQALPPEEQQSAKQQYFSQVVAQKPEFQSLEDNEKQAAAQQFLEAPKQEEMHGAIAQAGKGFYEAMHQIPGVRQFMDVNPELGEMANEVPEPTGLGDKAARMVGQGVGLTPAFAGGEALAGGTMIGGALGVGAQQAAGDIQEGKSPIQAATSGALTAGLTYAGGKVLNAAGELVENATKPVAQKISDTIGDLYNKAVKPTIVKGNNALTQQNKANVESGIRAIVDNKENLSLGDEGSQTPETLSHTSEAIEQTKNDIFNKYNDLQKQATGQGVKVNGLGLAQSLQPIIDDKALEVVSPQTKDYAIKLFDRLQSAGDMTPEEAQNMIKGFNGRLKAYYRNPSPDQYGNTAVDALVANNTRKQLDDAITSSVGEGYQGLKNQYGALSSMEKDVARAAQRSSNYQNKGLLDFSDIFTGEQVARGILSGNPAELASGIGGRLIKEYYKRLNNPDANIKEMFSKVGKYIEQEKQPSLQENISAATQKAKESLGGLADAVPNRFAMAGKVGYPKATPDISTPEGMQAEGGPAGQAQEPNPFGMTRPNVEMKNGLENMKSPGSTSPIGVDTLADTKAKNLSQAQSNPLASRWAEKASQEKTGENVGKFGNEGKSNLKTIGATAALTASGAAIANAKNHKAINDEDAIKTIIGEGESTGFQGMRALASAIRNRGTLQGAYGINSPRVVNHLYSPKTERLARQAWEDSKKKDWSGGANHWFSDSDLKKANVQKMIKGMQKLGYYRGNTFYKEGKSK